MLLCMAEWQVLPYNLKTWDFIPVALRSLEPCDRLIFKPGKLQCQRIGCCKDAVPAEAKSPRPVDDRFSQSI
jgi:hypothetical protein